MDDFRLHAVFCHYAIEVVYDVGPVGCLAVALRSGHIMLVGQGGCGSHFPLVYAYSSKPEVTVCVLQPLGWTVDGYGYQEGEYGYCFFHFLFLGED